MNSPDPLYPYGPGVHGNTKHGHATRHGGTSRTYRIWSCVLQRCLNSNNSRYLDYGGRGIWVCEEWRDSFLAFLRDMGECPKGYVIDRVNNDAGYYKANCRWVSYQTSAQNKRIYKSNKSGKPGVGFSKAKGKWAAYASIGEGIQKHLGYFNTLEAAISRREKWEAENGG